MRGTLETVLLREPGSLLPWLETFARRPRRGPSAVAQMCLVEVLLDVSADWSSEELSPRTPESSQSPAVRAGVAVTA